MSNLPDTIKTLINAFSLTPHPEGGYFREIFLSENKDESKERKKKRSEVTKNKKKKGKGDISRKKTEENEENWKFYQGDPLTLICFDGKEIQTTRIGPGCSDFTFVVKGGLWQAAESTGGYTLVGCTVAPGFDFKDFSFLSDSPDDLKAFRESQMEYERFL